jgi:hypothetical protein
MLPTYKSDLLISVTIGGSTTVKLPLCRHRNCSYILGILCSWKIAWSPVETLRYIISLSSKFTRKDVFCFSAKSIRKDKHRLI